MDAPLASRGRLQEDRQATGSFERDPEMTRAEFDDVETLCLIMYSTLRNVLDRVPLTTRGTQQRRVAQLSEFRKFGMARRVFNYLKRHTYTQDQWYSPKAVFEIVLEEFDRLAGSEGRHLAIPNFHFLDDHERQSLARNVTRRFTRQDVSSVVQH